MKNWLEIFFGTYAYAAFIYRRLKYLQRYIFLLQPVQKNNVIFLAKTELGNIEITDKSMRLKF